MHLQPYLGGLQKNLRQGASQGIFSRPGICFSSLISVILSQLDATGGLTVSLSVR